MNKLVILFAVALCGASAYVIEAGVENRISNGNAAADNQFPYMISLQATAALATPTRGHRCGGVLVTFQHALTAASCTYNVVSGSMVPITANQYRVFAGSSFLTNDTSPELIRTIANFTVHPEHMPTPAHINDIAIITLTTPYLNTTVRPLALPNVNFAPADFTLCSIAGWGTPSTTVGVNTSVELRYAQKYIYNQPLCQTIYANRYGVSNVFPSMVCAASFDIISAGCEGDVGGPLVCEDQLTGILFHTNNCEASSFPELYTRVSNHTAWIRSITGGASTFKPAFGFLALFTVFQVFFVKLVV